MVSLSDRQLWIVQTACQPLAPEKRGVFLERVAGILRQRRGGNFNDDDVSDACAWALKGLIHAPAA
jgi:hypothetical protein